MSTTAVYHIGDQPGNGRYRCQSCGEYVAQLLGPEEQLPPCERCGSEGGVTYRADNEEANESHGPK